MKTSITRINRNATISLLDWHAASSRLGEAIISPPKSRKQVRAPHFRIVSEVGNRDLFKYATAAKSATGFWETIVYAALGLGAIVALVMTFGI
jgi:hypothetical protein